MEFLMQYHLLGLVIGIATFLIIGLFHPVVVKAEYYWGTGCWWIFLLLGIGGIVWSLCTDNWLAYSLFHRCGRSKSFSSRKSACAKVGFPAIRNVR